MSAQPRGTPRREDPLIAEIGDALDRLTALSRGADAMTAHAIRTALILATRRAARLRAHFHATRDGVWITEGGGVAMATVMRGVVADAPVGTRRMRSLRFVRYEVRRWRDGVIPDIGEAAESPQQLTDDPLLAQRVLDLVPAVPALVW